MEEAACLTSLMVTHRTGTSSKGSTVSLEGRAGEGREGQGRRSWKEGEEEMSGNERAARG